MSTVSQEVPGIDLTDPEVIRDPFTAYGRVRERSPLARLLIPGMNPMWAVLRYEDARAMLTDPRFELSAGSFAFKPEVPDEYLPYLRSMGEMNGPEHLRLRRLVAPSFTARRAAEFRPRIEPIVEGLLDELPVHAEGGSVDLVPHLARPLPMKVICEIAGIPEADRAPWRECGMAIAAGSGPGLAQSLPAVLESAKAAVAARRAKPTDDLISDLLRAQTEDGDRLSDTELVTLVWNIVLAGQTPTNLVANGVETLLGHPDQLAGLRAEPSLMRTAVEELMRWCGPQLLAIPRFTREEVEVGGITIGKGEQVTAALVSVNRDPRAFSEPERLDLGRNAVPAQLGFAHGPHFCLGAALARVQTEVALTALLRRFPSLALAPEGVRRASDGGTWRLAALPVTL